MKWIAWLTAAYLFITIGYMVISPEYNFFWNGFTVLLVWVQGLAFAGLLSLSRGLSTVCFIVAIVIWFKVCAGIECITMWVAYTGQVSGKEIADMIFKPLLPTIGGVAFLSFGL